MTEAIQKRVGSLMMLLISPLANTIPAGVVLLWYEGYKILENP